MNAHATTARRLAVKAPREHDSGHLIRGIGFTSECTCGWSSHRFAAWNEAANAGRAHVREHDMPAGATPIPPPGTIPPPRSGEDTSPTRERGR